MNKIKVFRISDDKLIAGDHGDITVESLREKMLKKGIDINDSQYRIEESVYDPEEEKPEREKALGRIKSMQVKGTTLVQVKVEINLLLSDLKKILG